MASHLLSLRTCGRPAVQCPQALAVLSPAAHVPPNEAHTSLPPRKHVQAVPGHCLIGRRTAVGTRERPATGDTAQVYTRKHTTGSASVALRVHSGNRLDRCTQGTPEKVGRALGEEAGGREEESNKNEMPERGLT